MNWWYTEYTIDGVSLTPTAYLEKEYNRKSDREIAQTLAQVTNQDITANAIRKRRNRLSLVKSETAPQVDYTETTNHIDLEANKPLTKDDLVRRYQIDVTQWEFARFEINSWQVAIKDNEGNLQTERLYKTGATLLRKQPLAINPVIQPMQGNVTNHKLPSSKTDNAVKTALIGCDLHIGFHRDLYSGKLTPFHSRENLSIFLQAARDLQPDSIHLLGDTLDLADWSDKFVRSPEFYFTTQPAIVEAYWFLTALRTVAPYSTIYLHEGNHDKRLQLAIEKYLPYAYDLKCATKLEAQPALSVPNLLDINSNDITYLNGYPNDIYLLNANLELMHGNTAKGEFNTVRDLAKNSDTSKVVGHIHRMEVASHTKWSGYSYRVIEAISPACLCKIDGSVPGTSARQQWQNGFMSLTYDPTDYTYQLHPIKNNRVICQQAIYTGLDYTAQLKADFPQFNW